MKSTKHLCLSLIIKNIPNNGNDGLTLGYFFVLVYIKWLILKKSQQLSNKYRDNNKKCPDMLKYILITLRLKKL